MFLFDRERTGRLPFRIGERAYPELVWETKLRQLPPKGPESSAVIDHVGNLYFGCHDNGIYSLDASGRVRWQFQTEDKVYSSPILLNERLYICCNKADVLCLKLDGSVDWVFEGFRQLKSLPKIRRVFGNLYSYAKYDYEFRKYMKINAWGSPNLLGDNSLVVNLYGLGVVVLEGATGNVLWKYDLGLPYNHLAGVAVTMVEEKDFIAAVSQSNHIFWINEQGKLIWKRNLEPSYNSWGNPSIDPSDKGIYCSSSKANYDSVVYKFNSSGDLLWSRRVQGGIRGSITISHSDFVLVPTMSGSLLFLSKKNGEILLALDIAAKERGLWTSAAIDLNDTILINVKSSQNKGALMKISKNGDTLWRVDYGKALAVPVIDNEGHIYTATWDGKYLKYKS